MAKPPVEMMEEEPIEAAAPVGQVLATITQNEDGSYGLQAGEAAEPASYASIGELMGAVLDVLEGTQPGDEQAAMTEAFSGQASPPKGGGIY